MPYYVPKDLKTQLMEYAARRVVAKITDAAATAALRKIESSVRTQAFLRNLNPSITKENPMSFRDQAAFAAPTTQGQARQAGRQTTRRRDEPVELWVNTVIVAKDGDAPIRILTGRPLASFTADRPVTTSNEDFNRANAIHNAFVNMMNKDAAKLNLGEAKYYSPRGVEMVEQDGETVPVMEAGIYLQLFREVTDPAADAAAKHDIEATAEESLRNLFG